MNRHLLLILKIVVAAAVILSTAALTTASETAAIPTAATAVTVALADQPCPTEADRFAPFFPRR